MLKTQATQVTKIIEETTKKSLWECMLSAIEMEFKGCKSKVLKNTAVFITSIP